MLARETVRLKLNTRENRTAFFRQQRDFLAQSLAGAGVSGQKLAAELEAFDAATGKLETFVDTLAAGQKPAQESNHAEPPQPKPDDTPPATAAKPSGGRLSKRLAIVVAVILVLGVSAPFALPGIVYPVFDDLRKKLPVQYRHACDTQSGVKDVKQLLAVCT